jgi:hypothetical protein
MRPKKVSLGLRVDRLCVIGETDIIGDRRKLICKCDCGNEKIVTRSNFFSGKTHSCGCLNIEKTTQRNFIHGHKTRQNVSPEYLAWRAMIQRCENKNTKHYKRYGGRNIKIYPPWRESFENFLSDNGFKPSPKHSLDRINNDGNYEPGNCRWATLQEQQRNKKNSIKVDGIALIDFANQHKLNYGTVRERYFKGDKGATLIRPVLNRRNKQPLK